MSSVPADFRYTKSHEWIKVDGDVVTIGITDHAQEELGDVVYVELPEVGRVLANDDVFGNVESVKAVSELYAPVAGEVVEVNEALNNAEAAINEDPYERGWMIRVRLKNPDEVASLLTADAYKAEIGE
ncbi:MAG TPA: glycine cleavage system protein GcvH [Armatimonadaceae bacterium]|nr:glycine cleavage system protein GcvH [Armatimonadaceae bacterium]